MDRKTNALWFMPLGLLLGGLIGFVFGLAIDNATLWLILGAGGGLILGLAAGTAVNRRQA